MNAWQTRKEIRRLLQENAQITRAVHSWRFKYEQLLKEREEEALELALYRALSEQEADARLVDLPRRLSRVTGFAPGYLERLIHGDEE